MYRFRRTGICALCGLLLLGSVLLASAQSNSVWHIPVGRLSFSDVSFPEFVRHLEDVSRSLDPEQRGVRILYPKPFMHMRITLDAEDVPLGAVFKLAAIRTCIIDDTALLLYEPEGAAIRLAGFFGRCVSAATAIPVTNVSFSVIPDLTPPLQFAIHEDGTFLLVLPYIVRRAFLSCGYSCEVMEPIALIKVTAPGYQEHTMCFPVGDFSSTVLPLEIKLHRDDGRAAEGAARHPLGSEAGATHPRQTTVAPSPSTRE